MVYSKYNNLLFDFYFSFRLSLLINYEIKKYEKRFFLIFIQFIVKKKENYFQK